MGQETTVPNNDLAKLMYYLDCITTVIEYDDYNILTDYKHYYNLTLDQKKEVYKLAILFNPKIFTDAGVFIVNSDLLHAGWSNKFYKLTDETFGIHVNQELMIGGRSVRVLKFMVCDSSWLKIHYHDPLERLIIEIERRLCPGQSYSAIVNTETSMISENSIVINQSIEFRTHPVSMFCQYCKSNIRTTTKFEIICISCCCFLIFNILYLLCKACADKNICYCDVTDY